MWRQIVGGWALALTIGGVASAQNESALALQRQDRLQQLQQFELDTRQTANEAIPAGQRALIDYGGYFSPQYFSVDDSNGNNHGLREYDLVGYFRANFDNVSEFFMRGRVEYNDYNPGDSFDGLGSRLINPDFDRIYYKWDLQQYEAAYNGKSINGDIQFEGGRDLAYWGNGVTLAKVVDGIFPTFTLGKLSLQTVFGVTPTRTVDFEPDRPNFDHNTRRGFYGGMLSMAIGQNHPYIYGLAQQDYNQFNSAVSGPITTQYGYNSNYVGAGSTGALSDHVQYGVELVHEFGTTYSDSSVVNGFLLTPIPQTIDSIRAYAADARIDYVPQDVHNSRYSMEALAASGDNDRGLTNTTFNGNAAGTADHAFNAFGLLNTGLAFGAAPSNLLELRIGGSTFPFVDHPGLKRLQVGTDIMVFAKASAAAPIDEATTKGRQYLGWEPDLYLNWEIASDVTLALRYGVFIPDEEAFQSSAVRHFLYAGATFAF